jgi:HD-GYP domain-containing protein (c-di-GMP phosphodiesterase class II)
MNGVIAPVEPLEMALSHLRGDHAPDVRVHGRRTRELSLRIAAALGLLSELRDSLILGAALHDIGKLVLPPSLLNKRESLDDDDWIVIKSHPEAGEEMLRDITFLSPALPVIRHHHERWDGTGYPDRLAGEEIPIEARIVSIADAFDAMTSDRPYRKAMSVSSACAEIARCAGTQLDPKCARMFVDLIQFSELTLGGMLRRRPRSDRVRRAS